MKLNNCEIVRRELDEMMLDERCSATALTHLNECSECREFHEKQTRLRQIVGSLGTVAAPADFDFRLRARLANESNGGSFQLAWFSSVFARRGVAVAAALLLFIAIGVVVVRNVMKGPERVETAVTNQQTPNPGNQTSPAPAPEQGEQASLPQVVATAGQNDRPIIRSDRPRQPGLRPRRNIVSEDFSGQRAERFSFDQTIDSSEAFAIDASVESFKISLDDGRGNARTISLPTIRFGSQRMLPGSNQYAKGVW